VIDVYRMVSVSVTSSGNAGARGVDCGEDVTVRW
jgi:hypothetical protein